MTTPNTPISPGKAVESVGSPGTGKDFSSLMRESGGQKGDTDLRASSASSPLQVTAPKPTVTTAPTMDSMLVQAKTMQDSLGKVGQQLKTPNLSLKRSQTHLLKNKLSGARDYIRQAGEKVGVEPKVSQAPSLGGPVDRFLSYINDGQDQLIGVQQQLKKMAAKGQQLNAGDMLSITVKMNLAQQEIEYSSTLLAKVIESIKQIMNIQL